MPPLKSQASRSPVPSERFGHLVVRAGQDRFSRGSGQGPSRSCHVDSRDPARAEVRRATRPSALEASV